MTGITIEELRDFSKVSNFRGALGITWIWTCITLTLAAVFLWPNPLTIIAAFILMARHQKALGTMAHDGAHRRIFTNRALNDALSQAFLASPIHLILDGYRHTHMKHHRVPLQDDDPDIGITGGYPISRKSFARKLVRDMTGQTYVKFVRHFVFPTKRTKRVADPHLKKKAREKTPGFITFGSMLFWNASMLALFWTAGHPLLFLVLWLLPQMTLLQVFLRIRGITEHAGYQAQKDQALCTRTVTSRWQSWFLAPNQINYHIEHHLYPSVPCYRLPALHRLMKARGALPEANVYRSYGEVMSELVVAKPSALSPVVSGSGL